MSIYGWWRWRRDGAAAVPDRPAITPRWATARERAATSSRPPAAILVCRGSSAWIGAGWPAPRWYFWCDAWIFVGSMLATYAMARGWVDFWLAGSPSTWSASRADALAATTRRRSCTASTAAWWSGASWRGGAPAAPSAIPDPSKVDRMSAPPCGSTRSSRPSPTSRRQGGGRRRRRGPRERGRPGLRGQQVHAGAGGVHGPVLLRRDVRADGGATLDRLGIPLMTPHNRERMRTAYTVSVDARDGVTTGISAADRAHTIRVLVDSATEAVRDRAARPRVPAALPRGRRARAARPHRGRRRPGPARRPRARPG